MNEVIYIYTLTDPITGLIRYVGKTKNPAKRYANHLCKKANTYTSKWIISLREQDKLPILEILEETNLNDWEAAERYWIEQMKQWGFSLTNHLAGGGVHLKDWSKVRREGSWNKGKKSSKETRRKISEHHKKFMDHSYKLGRKQSLETIEKRVSKFRGIQSSNSKFTQEDLNDIKLRLSSGERNYILAKEYGVRRELISRIKTGKAYNT